MPLGLDRIRQLLDKERQRKILGLSTLEKDEFIRWYRRMLFRNKLNMSADVPENTKSDFDLVVDNQTTDLARLLNNGFQISSTPKIALKPGKYKWQSNHILPSEKKTFVIQGSGVPTNIYAPVDGTVLDLNGFTLSDARGSNFFQILFLRDICATVSGTYAGANPIIQLSKTLVFCDNVAWRFTGSSTVDGIGWAHLGSAGPPGIPALWRNTTIYDARAGSQLYTNLMMFWYEGIESDGCSIVNGVSGAATALGFLKYTANTEAQLRNWDVFSAKSTKVYNSWIEFGVPDVDLDNVEFNAQMMVPGKPNFQVNNSSSVGVNFNIGTVRLEQAGPITMPIIKQIGTGSIPNVKYRKIMPPMRPTVFTDTAGVGNIVHNQPRIDTYEKLFLAHLNRFADNSVAETITYQVPFTYNPWISRDDSDGASSTTTQLTVPAIANDSPKTGWIEVRGY